MFLPYLFYIFENSILVTASNCNCYIRPVHLFQGKNNSLSYYFRIVIKCFIYDILDATVSHFGCYGVERHHKGLNLHNLFQICSRRLNKHTVVVKFSNTSLDDLSVSKVSLWCIRNGKLYPSLSSLRFEKVILQIDFLFTEYISALYKASKTVIGGT